MRSIIKSRRGDASSIIVITVFLLVFALIALVGVTFVKPILTEVLVSEEIQGNSNAVSAITTLKDNASGFIDYAFIFIFVGLILGLFVTAYFTDANPIFIVIYIIMMIIAVFLASQFSNLWYDVSTDPNLETYANELPMTKRILSGYFPLIMLVVAIIGMIILYGKSQSGGGTAV